MYEELNLAALTGILVSAEQYIAVRDEMCRFAVDVQPSAPNVIPEVIEFHARAFLDDVAHLHGDRIDEVRLSTLQRVVDLVSEHRLSIYRVTYLNRTEIAALMPRDPKLYGLTFFGIQSWLQSVMADKLVIPVMDGIPHTGGINVPRRAPNIEPMLIRLFALNVRSIHHFRQYPSVADCLSIANAHNLGEPVFGDSTHSVFLQLVDLLSHMLLQKERAELEDASNLTDYRRKTLQIVDGIPPDLLHMWKGKMRIGGADVAQHGAPADGPAPGRTAS
ncbi:MAG: hypothetical protein H6934_03440 [Burkholderiaceae bacterium]|nr:hypothetical protein [Burkholderiaceae bacterium]